MEYKIINGTTAELKFYGYIAQWYNGADDYTTTLDVLTGLGITDVNVMVHCYGGSVFEGSAIWTANKTSKINIHFKVVGIAASMMAVILLSGSSVEVSSMAKVMFHAPHSNASTGTSKQLFQEANLLKKMEKDFMNAWMQRTGQGNEQAQQLMDGTDYWYNAEECVQLGIAQKIMPETAFVTDLQGKPDAGTPVDKVFGTYTAFFNDKKQTMDNNAIINRFVLQGVTAQSSDTNILDALSAQLTAKDKRIAELTAAIDKEKETAIDTLIASKEKAVNIQFTDEQKKQFRNVGKVDMDALQTVLDAFKPAPNVKNMLNNEGKTAVFGNQNAVLPKSISAERKDWTLKDWAEKAPAALEQMSESNEPDVKAYFEKLYAEQYPA